MSWLLIYLFSLSSLIFVRMYHKYKNNPDGFCYIYSNVVLPNHQAKITDFVKKVYCNYFGVKQGDQDKPFAPHICCKTCVENLRDWKNCKKNSMSFAIPMIKRKEKDHLKHCYFRMINLKGINHKNKLHDDSYKPEEYDQPVPLTQTELNDLTWDLNRSKESAQLLGSCLKDKHLLAPGTTLYWYQDWERIKTVFHITGKVIIGLLLDWSNQWA